MDESAGWSDLPPKLCRMVRKRLNSEIDVLRLRSICKSWRSSIYPTRTVPRRIITRFGERLLTRTTIYCLELSDLATTFPSSSLSTAWLIKVEGSKYRRLCLLNPFTNERLSSSDTTYPSDSFAKLLNLLNFRFVELVKTYSISLNGPGQRFHPCESGKVVAFPNFAWTIENCMFFCVDRDGKLGFSKIGDDEWTLVDDKNFWYDDIIVHKDRLYVVDRWGIIYWIDCSSLKLTQFSPPFCPFVDNKKKHLVESFGSLYVDMFFEGGPTNPSVIPNNVLGLKVYKLEEEWGRWSDVKSLDEHVFFLSKDCNFSISAQDYHGCEGNCVYFCHKGRVSMFNLRTSTSNSPEVFWPCPTLFDLCFFPTKKRKHRSKSDESVGWSDLHPELCRMIFERLNSKIDLLHFRSICKSWRSSVSPSAIVSPRFPQKITTRFGKRLLTCTTIYRLGTF